MSTWKSEMTKEEWEFINEEIILLKESFKYLIEVEGTYHIFTRDAASYDDHVKVVEKCIADMLRYDNGAVRKINLETDKKHFTCLVTCSSYTPDRWHSFGLKTKEL